MAGAVASYEIWGRVVCALLDAVAMGGLPTASLLEDLSFDAASIRRTKRVPWEEYCIICERVAAMVGNDADVESLVEDNLHRALPELGMIAGAVIEPRAFIRFVTEVIDPLVIPSVDFRFEDLGTQHIRVRALLRPGAMPCAPFFRGSLGGLRGLTRHLGLPALTVTHADIGPDHGIYEFNLPLSRTIASRATRASRALLAKVTATLLVSEDEAVPVMAADEREPLDVRIDEVTDVWSLTRRQIAVLKLLARGQSNKEIAQSLACADNTVELHVTQLLKKARVTSRSQLIARFWSGE